MVARNRTSEIKKAAVVGGVYIASACFLGLFVVQGLLVGFATAQPYLFLAGSLVLVALAFLAQARLVISK